MILPTKVVIVDNYIRSAKRDPLYIGMNYWAAKELEAEFPYSKNTILVVDPNVVDISNKMLGFKVHRWKIKDVVLHEQTEARLMQMGLGYDEAHMYTVELTEIIF
jgi:hypothetical protein